MKILLIAVNSKFIHSNLAVRYLKHYTSSMAYECCIKEVSINENIDKVLKSLIEEETDIIGFSCYIWNIEYIVKLSKLLKLIKPNLKILLGGPEVSYDPIYYIERGYVDFLIQGEGEGTYRDFLEELINSEDIKLTRSIPGMYYKEGSEVIYGGIRKPLDMDELPESYIELPENKIIYYEASRGCPFSCIYCLSSATDGVRFKSINKVKEELSYFIKNNIPLVKFVDRTFNCNSTFAEKIWSYLIGIECKTRFHFEISADLLTEKGIKLLSTAPKDRFQFEIGVQTTASSVLKNIRRNVSFEVLTDKVLKLKKGHNIKLHLDLIAGLPGEDFESFINSFNDVYVIEPEMLQLGFLKVLKGSLLSFQIEKWDMKYSPYPPYEILSSNAMDYYSIIKLKEIEEVLDSYYNSGRYTYTLRYLLKSFKSPYEFYDMFSNYYKEKGNYEKSLSFKDTYKVLLDFSKKHIDEDIIILNELLKYEYIINTKKSFIPEIFNRTFDKDIIKHYKDLHKEDGNVFHAEIFEIDIKVFIDKSIIIRGKYCNVFLGDKVIQYKVN
ncbi:MAG TPA: DUF4080 domain-containing protein [Clostridiaceae bacterium]